MRPHTTYRIWFTPRTGSTLLCKGLESTGLAGKPHEAFNVEHGKTLFDMHEVNNYEDLKNKLWQEGSSSNGVFGLKHSFYKKRWDILMQEMIQMRQVQPSSNINHEAIWADLFPNCKHIYLTRRNKVRQAVSWWKAIQDNTWHIEAGQNKQQNSDEFYDKNYNFDALSHLFKEATLRECAIQSYFKQHHIQPLTIVYEDYIENFEASIRQIVEYLDVDSASIPVGEFFYSPTANQKSEGWVQRFRADLQKGMDPEVW